MVRAPASDGAAIHVVDGGWHTELVVPAGQVPPPLPVGTRAVSVGFGARGWYMAEAPGSWDGVEAVLGGPGVLLVRPLPAPAETVYDPARAVALAVAPEGAAGLRAFLARTLAPMPIRLADGPHPGSAFYATETRYRPAYTCNTWVVDALRAAGLPVRPWGVVTAGQAMRQARRVADAQTAAARDAQSAVQNAAQNAAAPAAVAPRRSRLTRPIRRAPVRGRSCAANPARLSRPRAGADRGPGPG